MASEPTQPGSQRAGDGAPDSAAGADAGGDAQSPQQVRLELDASDVQALYANLCLVSSTPEEVILDLALNPNPLSNQNRRIRISQRVIMNHFTAKRLVSLLASAVQRHEQAFGMLETDLRKRVKSGQSQPE